MIRGVIGFSYISGHLFGTMMIVRGKRVINVVLPIGIYGLMRRLWGSKNILRKIFYKESIEFNQLENNKK